MQHTNKSGTLNRGLKERHITLILLGSAIGVGLFLGSASAIKLAGPSILLGYMIAGLVIFFIMRALGEMAIEQPVAGSFSKYANDYIGPLARLYYWLEYWFLWLLLVWLNYGGWNLHAVLVYQISALDLGRLRSIINERFQLLISKIF